MKTAEKEGNEFDAIWLVFDHDHNPKRKEVWEAAKKENFKVAFSSIAFEQWYLLHFSQTARRFENAAALIKILKKHLPLYEKAKQNDFTLLKNHLENACKNAAWLRKTNFDEFKHVTDHNPWTNVDELVLFLVNLGK